MLRKRQVNSWDDWQVVREMVRGVEGKGMDKQQGQRERTSQTWEGLGVSKGEMGRWLKSSQSGDIRETQGNGGGM